VSNKAANHLLLDNALKKSLLNCMGNTRLEWAELEKILFSGTSLKVRGPQIPFSLNALATVTSSTAITGIKSFLSFTKRWYVAIYVSATVIVVTTGGFLWLDSVKNKKLHRSEIRNIESKNIQAPAYPQVSTSELSKKEEEQVAPPNQVSDAPASIGKPADLNQSAPMEENSNPGRTNLPETNAVQQVSSEPMMDKNLVDSVSVTGKPEGDTVTDTKESEYPQGSKAKILYYKESLSLDKLEQELSKDKRDSLR